MRLRNKQKICLKQTKKQTETLKTDFDSIMMLGRQKLSSQRNNGPGKCS